MREGFYVGIMQKPEYGVLLGWLCFDCRLNSDLVLGEGK